VDGNDFTAVQLIDRWLEYPERRHDASAAVNSLVKDSHERFESRSALPLEFLAFNSI
jgi:hypothetical protein